MSKIYYAVTPSFCNVTRYVNEGDFDKLRDLVFQLTGLHTEADIAIDWCKRNKVGKTYEASSSKFDFTIEIIEDEE